MAALSHSKSQPTLASGLVNSASFSEDYVAAKAVHSTIATKTEVSGFMRLRVLARSPFLRLLALSFAALFLELMMIRWVPAVVRLVAYYANLLLISSFVGLGVGSLLSARKLRVYRWLPFIFLAYICFLILARHVTLPVSPLEFRFFGAQPGPNYIVLVTIFVLNAVVFVPIGERIG